MIITRYLVTKRSRLLNFRLLVLAALAASGFAEETHGALKADDECRAEDGEGCGLSALQLRGTSKFSPVSDDIMDELEDPDDEEDEEEETTTTTTEPKAEEEPEKEEQEEDDENAPDTEEDQPAEGEEDVTTTTVEGEPHPEDANCAQVDQQCGGQWYYGPQCCPHDHICYEVNQYYSKCVTHETAEEMAKHETTTTTTTTNADPQNCRMGYQQCGGTNQDTKMNYTGTTCCHAGFFCKQVDRFYSQCEPVDKNSSFMPYEPTEQLQENSNATLFTFYVYRAATEDDDYVENINVGDLGGTLWYLHNEVVWERPRKFGISRILRYKIQTRAPQPLYDLGMNFGVRFSYDAAQCTGPWSCDVNYEKFGYFVGCNNLGMFPFPTYDTHYPNAKWFALPGECSSKKFEDKDEKCKVEQPGGRCEGTPTGQGNCTYSIELIGNMSLDEIEGIPPYEMFIHMAGEHVEYNKTTDKGVGVTFWDGINDTAKNVERIERVRMLFEHHYPDQALDEDMTPPACDFDFEVFYGTSTTTTTTVGTTTTTLSTESTTTKFWFYPTSAAPTTETEAATSEEVTTSEETTGAPIVTTTTTTTTTTTVEAVSTTAETVNATTEAATEVAETTTLGPTTTPYGCKDATIGSHCYSSVVWAMEHGLKLHPTWYPGLTSESTFAEFQGRVHLVTPDVCPVPCTAHAGCHDAVEGESCYSAVKWAMKSGIKRHPKWSFGCSKRGFWVFGYLRSVASQALDRFIVFVRFQDSWLIMVPFNKERHAY
ncbi:unnamed protein product [Symbiodinium pilosum]|uniref:CBM1 domain-containing protein n=1 Tax=Symbiodinium pilosum TaxID=2952 RepID=A0A812NFJ0_SYMPI|nr:unnamed protein product [Symbiodinium pilosum]